MQPRIIARSEHSISRKQIDPDALKVLYRLYRSGHTAFLVGGGVRDLLIGRSPKDFDISTSARPGQVKKLFRNCWLIGRRFRLAHIHFRDHKIVEVSTFRAEPQREPGESEEDLLVRQDNTFGTPEEDALRRDFTINGLFYDIASFSIIDYVGGVDDIESGVIRTIGDPSVRFKEDPVRMLRAIKFAARLDFSIEPETWEALCVHAEEIRKSSPARVLEEIARLTEGGGLCRSIQLLKASGLLPIVLPELHEYLHGTPAGPGLQASSARNQPSAEGLEVEQLLHADEDTDHEAQERMFLEAHPDESAAVEAVDEEQLCPGEGELIASDDKVGDGGAAQGSADEDVDDVLESALVLGEDGEAASPYLTEEGLRCPLSPDRGAMLWRTLSAVDQLIRQGRTLTRSTVFAALFHPLLQHTAEWHVARRGGAVEAHQLTLLRPLTGSLVITRRDRERVCQMLASQRKLGRGPQGTARQLVGKPYFAEALDLFEIVSLASSSALRMLAQWREEHPPLQLPKVLGRVTSPVPSEGRESAEGGRSRRSRRRRGGRGARDEGSADAGEAGSEESAARRSRLGGVASDDGDGRPRAALRSEPSGDALTPARGRQEDGRARRGVGSEHRSSRGERRREQEGGEQQPWGGASDDSRRDPERGRRERGDRATPRDGDIRDVAEARSPRGVGRSSRDEDPQGSISSRRSGRGSRDDSGERSVAERGEGTDRGRGERSRLSRRGSRGRSSLKMSERVGGDLTADSAPPAREETRRRRRRPSVASR